MYFLWRERPTKATVPRVHGRHCVCLNVATRWHSKIDLLLCKLKKTSSTIAPAVYQQHRQPVQCSSAIHPWRLPPGGEEGLGIGIPHSGEQAEAEQSDWLSLGHMPSLCPPWRGVDIFPSTLQQRNVGICFVSQLSRSVWAKSRKGVLMWHSALSTTSRFVYRPAPGSISALIVSFGLH